MTMSPQDVAELRILLGPKPKRPLSAYNLFFRSERQKMISSLPTRSEGKPARSHGKCGFAEMAKTIAKKWNEDDIDPEERLEFNRISQQEKARYQQEMETFRIRRTAIFGSTKKKISKSSKRSSSSAISTHDLIRAQTVVSNTCVQGWSSPVGSSPLYRGIEDLAETLGSEHVELFIRAFGSSS